MTECSNLTNTYFLGGTIPTEVGKMTRFTLLCAHCAHLSSGLPAASARTYHSLLSCELVQSTQRKVGQKVDFGRCWFLARRCWIDPLACARLRVAAALHATAERSYLNGADIAGQIPTELGKMASLTTLCALVLGPAGCSCAHAA